MKFIGRKHEIERLKSLKSLSKASLVVCRGRRRIGKSRLINEFAKEFGTYVQIQGLAPTVGQTVDDQLQNFMQTVCSNLNLPQISAKNWAHGFELLGAFTEGKEVLVFLDEISWMAQGDRNFPGLLKIAWDTIFKKNSKLILVVCGSITSWIDNNILNSSDFMGRISLTITLKELQLSELKKFLLYKKMSNIEGLKILAITGGVPRYLEEIDSKLDAQENIKKLCFQKEGILYSEFDKIFSDIFSKRASLYREIIQVLIERELPPNEIGIAINSDQSGVLTRYLEDLIESGFLKRSFAWNLKNGVKSKLSRYRVSDNYLRFYLKYISPNNLKIEEGLYSDLNSGLPMNNLDSILGLQLESLILNNIKDVFSLLKISSTGVVNFGPYFQNKTLKQKSCQVDLLIQTDSTYYVCEIKFRKKIGLEVVGEVQDKIKKLKLDPRKNVRTVLFYAGSRLSSLENNDYFDFQIESPRDFWLI